MLAVTGATRRLGRLVIRSLRDKVLTPSGAAASRGAPFEDGKTPGFLKPVALAALIAVPLAGPAYAADCVGEGLAGLEYNKAIVTAFYKTAVNAKDPAGAVACYMGDYYIQHNPLAPDGAEAFIAAFEAWTAAAPEIHLDFKRVIAEGDLVVTHAHLRQSPDDLGLAVMDIFWIEDGKIVEHWDVVQPVPEESANDNTMF